MNFVYVSNDKQTENLLYNIIEEVTEEVSQILLEDFQHHLDETVYGVPEGAYKRNYDKGGFYSGWGIKEDQKSMVKGIIKSLYFDGGKLVSPTTSNSWAHGGDYAGDQRGKMAWILNSIEANYNISYNDGARYLSVYKFWPPYWDSYMNVIDKKMERWIDEAFKKRGITRR